MMYFARRRARLALAREGLGGRVIAVLPVTGPAVVGGPRLGISIPVPLPVAAAGAAVGIAYAVYRLVQRRPRRDVPKELRPTGRMLLVATEERLLVLDDTRSRPSVIWEDLGRLRGASSRPSDRGAGDSLTIQIARHPDVSFEVNGLLIPERTAMLRAIDRLVRP